MNVGDERSRSLWMDVEVAPDAKALRRDAKSRYGHHRQWNRGPFDRV